VTTPIVETSTPPPKAAMPKWSWRPVVWQAVMVIGLLWVLYVLASITAITLSPLAAPRQLGATEWAYSPSAPANPFYNPDALEKLQSWRQQFAQAPQPLTRTVTITTSSTELQISFDLWVSATHPIASLATEGLLDAVFTQGAFGTLINTSPRGTLARPAVSVPTWTLDAGSGVFQLHQEATVALGNDGIGIVGLYRDVYGPSSEPLFIPQNDEFVLKPGDLKLYIFQPVPDESRAGSVIIKRTAKPSVPSVFFVISAQALRGDSLTAALAAAKTSQASLSQPPTETPQTQLQRLGQVPLLWARFWVFGVGLAVPLLIFWYWLRGGSVGAGSRWPRILRLQPTKVLADGVSSVLVFHLVVYLLAVKDYVGLKLLQLTIEHNLQTFTYAGSWLLRNSGADWISLIVLGIVLPAALLQRSKPEPAVSGSPVWRRVVLSLAPLLAAALIAWVTLRAWPIIPVWQLVLGGTAFFAAFMFLAFMGLYSILAAKPARPGVAALAVLVLLALQSLAAFGQLESVGSALPTVPLLQSFTDGLLSATHQASLMSLTWTVIYAALGAFLIVSLARVLWGVVRQISPGWSPPRWVKGLGLALAVFLAIPALTSAGTIEMTASADPMQSLAFSLSDLARLAWLSGMVWLMYRSGRTRPAILPYIHAWGLLAASALFFNATESWLYVPITFLLGWWTMRRVIKPASYWSKLQPLLHEVRANRRRLLEQFIELDAAEGAFREFRKKQSAKLSSGELSLVQFEESIVKRRQEIAQLNTKTSIEGRSVRDVALEFGPYGSAWANGLHGTRMSLLFAIPWLIVFVQQLPQAVSPNEPYYVWVLVSSLVGALARWTAFGFFFGYFYPYLWGKNGLEKALGLFAATTVPTLLYTGLHNTSLAMWQASLVFNLQWVIQCLLLGLVAFDYFNFRRAHYDWQMVLQVHGLTFVGISVSTILAAVGVTITTLLTAQATGLVTNLLNLVWPHVR
jgi:hypothetical protein